MNFPDTVQIEMRGPGGVVVVGRFILGEDGLIHTEVEKSPPVPGGCSYAEVMDRIEKTPLRTSVGIRMDAKTQPGRWLRQLVKTYQGSYLWAKFVEN